MPDGNQFNVARHAVTIFGDHRAAEKLQLFCTLAELKHNIGVKSWPDKASMHWLKLAEFGDVRTDNNSLRHNLNVVAISGVEGDYDGGTITFDQAVELIRKAGVRALLYTTPSNTDAKPHWRACCPSSASLPPAERAKLTDRLNGILGGGLAPESWVLSQAYFFGSIDGQPPVRVELVEGDFIDKREDIVPIPKPGPAAKEPKPGATPREANTSSGSPEAPIVDLALYFDGITNEDRPWEEWNTVLMAAYAASGGSDLGLQLAVEWSEKSAKHEPGTVEARWSHYRTSPPTRIGAGMLRRMAADQAWITATAEAERAQAAGEGAPWPDSPPAGVDSSAFLMTEADIFAMPDPVPLVEGMLMQNENICLVGPPKTGKTFVALDIALSIAANVPVLGALAVRRHGAVVYLTAEGKAGFKRRIKAWRQARKIASDVKLPFYFKAAVPMTAQGTFAAKLFVEGIRSQVEGAVLVIIDTMARSLDSMNENDASSAAGYLNLTENIRSHLDTTMLTLAHASDKPNAALQIRGSSGFGAGFDSVWTLRMDKSNRTAKLNAHYMKDGDESDFGPFCFRMETEHVDGMENGKGAVLKLVSITEWNSSGEGATSEDHRTAYLRAALEAAGGRKFTRYELTVYLVEYDLAGGKFDENSNQHQLARKAKEDFLKNGIRPRERKGANPLPGYFAAFYDEDILGTGKVTRTWRAPPVANPW
jgi:hypothetical protein